MGRVIRNLLLTGLVGVIMGCASTSQQGFDGYIKKEGKTIDGLPITIIYTEGDCYRNIRIESPDGAYVKAEDRVDCDGEFETMSNDMRIGIGHQLAPYCDFNALEREYQRVKSALKNEI